MADLMVFADYQEYFFSHQKSRNKALFIQSLF